MLQMYVFGIIVGILIGILINSKIQRFNTNSLLKTIKKELLNAYEEGVKHGAIKLKIERINEISKIQLDYIGALDRPNASASHARHKNNLVSQVKSLEEEKITLFKSILEDGMDPLLTVVIDGVTKNLRASELLPILESGHVPPAETLESKTDSNSSVSTKSKLYVVKPTQENTDDRGESNPSNPAIH
jgi:hypothetical protein